MLCIFKAPEFHLWYLQIVVTEFSWIWCVMVVIMLVILIVIGKTNHFLIALNFLSLIFFLLPILRAYEISSELPIELQASFGKTDLSKKPFSFVELFGFSEKAFPFQTLVYDSANHLTLDYYQANLMKKRPCVIIVHGGSWNAGDSKQLPEINTFLSTRGFNVASINYRLSPKFTAPSPVQDIERAINYLSSKEDHLQLDSSRFFLLGRSAGGQIVLQAAYSLKDKRIKGVISFYGPADMIWGYKNPSSKLIMDSKKVMEDYLGGTLMQVRSNYVASSAVTYHNIDVPTLLIHGKLDPLVAYEHSVRLNNVLKENKTPHYLLSIPWATHGCEYTLHGPSGQLSTFAVEYFLNCYVN